MAAGNMASVAGSHEVCVPRAAPSRELRPVDLVSLAVGHDMRPAEGADGAVAGQLPLRSELKGELAGAEDNKCSRRAQQGFWLHLPM